MFQKMHGRRTKMARVMAYPEDFPRANAMFALFVNVDCCLLCVQAENLVIKLLHATVEMGEHAPCPAFSNRGHWHGVILKSQFLTHSQTDRRRPT